MDDYLGTNRDIDFAKETVVNVTKLLTEGRFRLTKWISNSNSLLEVLLQSEIAKLSTKNNSMRNKTEKILGIMWNYKNDTLNIKYSNTLYPNTKRGIVSHISPIFYPLGLLVPFLLQPKLIQQLWKEKIEYDDNISETLNNRWITWKQLWEQQDFINIPQYGFHDNNYNSTELHVFADASSLAYRAAAYFKSVSNNNVTTIFILAKSRLAPIKERLLNIRKLKLQAAVIAARMKETDI